MGRLSLSVLGPFQVTLDGQPVTSFKSDRVRALLAYLAVEAGRPHRRESLAGLLWPERRDAVARANLRDALFHLRHALRDHDAALPFLLIDRDSVQLDSTADVWVDVAAFEQHIAAGRGPLDGAGRQQADPAAQLAAIQTLEAAIDLYRGCFLDGFALRDGLAFEEWVLLKREQLARRMLSALSRLAAIHEQRGEYEQAQLYLRRLLELEPWEEEAHRRLMRLLALAGQDHAALAQYEVCRRLLAAELAVEPARETTALYERIKAGRLRNEGGQAGQLPLVPLPSTPSPSTLHSLQPRPPPFVARDRELGLLNAHLAHALAGRGRVVFVEGEAGSGKTVLLSEFARRAMTAHADLLVADGRCNEQAGIGDPYLPFREIMRLLGGDIEAGRAAGAIADEHARRLWEAVPAMAQALLEEGRDLIDVFVPGAALVSRVQAYVPADRARTAGLEALVKRRRRHSDRTSPRQMGLFEQVTAVMRSMARRQPLVLMLDDLQWADTASISLLFHTGRRLSGSRILVVGAYRPCVVASGRDGERHPLEPVVHELQREFGDIRVDLNQAEDRQFIDAFLDTEPNRLPAAFRETLYRHTGGHPLFTVELLHGMQDRGDLVRDEAGCWVEGPSLDWERLPARVEAVIAERVGRLPPTCRAVLEAACVEGEEFTAEVAARVQGMDPATTLRSLSERVCKQHQLVSAQSVVWLNGQHLSRYRFRHHLFQTYLYRQLDPIERSRLHASVGTALEALYGDQAAELAARLAHHFEAAGMASRAVDYLLQAGERAVRLSAHTEAVALFSRGLELLQTLPVTTEQARQELVLQLALLPPLLATRGWGVAERVAASARAYELATQLHETARLFDVLYWQAEIHVGRGQEDQAVELADQVLDLARRDRDTWQRAQAHALLGMVHNLRGDLVEAREHLEHALSLLDPRKSESSVSGAAVDLIVVCQALSAWASWGLGYPDQGLQRALEALARARELGRTLTLGFALYAGACALHILRREYQAVEEHVKTLRHLVSEKPVVIFQTWAEILEGWRQAEQGQVEAGIARMQEGIGGQGAPDTLVGHVFHRALLATAYGKAGRVEQGLAVVEEALSIVKQTGLRIYEPEVYRLKGELLLSRGGQEEEVREPGVRGQGQEQGDRDAGRLRPYEDSVREAEACFHRAIEAARRQQAKSWELRATTSLCRLWQRQGRREEAHRRLAEVYSWFTEGFDTRDLQAAQALLDELS